MNSNMGTTEKNGSDAILIYFSSFASISETESAHNSKILWRVFINITSDPLLCIVNWLSMYAIVTFFTDGALESWQIMC